MRQSEAKWLTWKMNPLPSLIGCEIDLMLHGYPGLKANYVDTYKLLEYSSM